MRGTIRSVIFFLAFAIALACVPAPAAQQVDTPKPNPEAAPVPAQIPAAKKVFIANGGVDGGSLAAFRAVGDPDYPYNQSYGAMKKWGHYELVSAPADADLVMEVSFAMTMTSGGDLASYVPHLRLTIVDARTHFTLWTLAEPVQGAIRKATFIKNFNQGMTNLVNDVAKLAGQPPAIPPEPKKKNDEDAGPPLP
ncbi:MAG TPA: hypothetical protein VE825_12935 [Terriglobales bacterium]|jgi:hypothetical protein|nr:hypothetical protein [Terriglobales bacterium]